MLKNLPAIWETWIQSLGQEGIGYPLKRLSLGEGIGYPLQLFCLETSMDRRSLVSYSPSATANGTVSHG